jgi:hypothetical protein
MLVLIGCAVAIRRVVSLWPTVMGGYHEPIETSNPTAAQFAALDDIFARHTILTLVHVVPGLLFLILGLKKLAGYAMLEPAG